MIAWERLKRFRAALLLLFALLVALPAAGAAAAPRTAPVSPNTAVGAPVVIVPVHQTIETGLQRFVERSLREADAAAAKYVVLDIDTLGGRVDSAEQIGQTVRQSKVPVVAYVHGKAVSAGSYIALNAHAIVMEPGSTIGSAAVVDASGNEIESAKVVSHWASEMRGAATLRDRNPDIAEAMVDKNAGVVMKEIGRTVQKGQLVSLTADEAYAVGYADKLAGSMQEVLQFLGAESQPVITINPSPAEKLARFVTEPVVATLLLIVGIAGIAIELLVPGFGLPGILGLLGFGLYFFGHYIAGFAGMEDIVLFAIGVLLLVIEIFVSSFGILGIAGIACLLGSVMLAAFNTKQAALSLGIAVLVAIVVVGFFIKLFKHRGIWNKFILRETLSEEKGFVSAPSKKNIVGHSGTALTPLRPAGTATIGDERIDVVTNGEFIAAGTAIVVVAVEGARVVVGRADRPAAGA